MKPAAEVLAALESRGLRPLAEEIAASRRLPLDRILTSSHDPELVAARHALYERLREELQSNSAVARLFGVDHSSVNVAMAAQKKISEVLLDAYRVKAPERGEPIGFRFIWQRGRGCAFGVVLVASPCDDPIGIHRIDWFQFYPAARLYFLACCRSAGAPSSYHGPGGNPDESSSGEVLS